MKQAKSRVSTKTILNEDTFTRIMDLYIKRLVDVFKSNQ